MLSNKSKTFEKFFIVEKLSMVLDLLKKLITKVLCCN